MSAAIRRADTDVDAWLAKQGDATLSAIDALIAGVLEGRSRRLWVGTFWGGTEQEIIGYADMTQERPRGPAVEWFAVGLAKQKRHYSLYVEVVDEGAYLAKHYADRLGRVKVGSASIAFKDAGALDRDALNAMLEHVDRLIPR